MLEKLRHKAQDRFGELPETAAAPATSNASPDWIPIVSYPIPPSTSPHRKLGAALEWRGAVGCGEPVKRGGDANEGGHPQVCAKCCAQFSNPTEFLTHQNECCPDPLVMMIIGDQENPSNSSASSASRPEGHSRPQVMDTEVSNSPDSGSTGPPDPTWGPERRGVFRAFPGCCHRDSNWGR